ncbi:MAG: IS66 family insertion sequence element accessory protein TnpB [Lachnospiraceae bacterium]|nr:IS66 family insertion sequence element accessory protein TnpB [Lachnospiraceae bacterium]
MLNLITQGAEHIYLACGPTDFRKQIEGLAALVSLRYHLDPYSPAC